MHINRTRNSHALSNQAILLVGILAVTILPAHSAVVILTSGKKIEGKLIRSDKGGVTLESFDGEFTIPAKFVKSLKEEEKSTYEKYLEQLETIENTAKDHLKLAQFCLKASAWKHARNHLEAAKELDPKHRTVAQMLRKLEKPPETPPARHRVGKYPQEVRPMVD